MSGYPQQQNPGYYPGPQQQRPLFPGHRGSQNGPLMPGMAPAQFNAYGQQQQQQYEDLSDSSSSHLNSQWNMSNVNCNGNYNGGGGHTVRSNGQDGNPIDQDEYVETDQQQQMPPDMMQPAQHHGSYEQTLTVTTSSSSDGGHKHKKSSNENLRRIEFVATIKIPLGDDLDGVKFNPANGAIKADLLQGNVKIIGGSHKAESVRISQSKADDPPLNVFPAHLKLKACRNGGSVPVRIKFPGITKGFTSKDDDIHWPDADVSHTLLAKSKAEKVKLLKRSPEASVEEFLAEHGTADPEVLRSFGKYDEDTGIVSVNRYSIKTGTVKEIPQANLIAKLYMKLKNEPPAATGANIQIAKPDFDSVIDEFRAELERRQRAFNINNLAIECIPENNVDGIEFPSDKDKFNALWHAGLHSVGTPSGNASVTVHGELVYLSTVLL